jgi:hypothetical protein
MGKNVQAIAILIRLRRYIESNPSLRLLECNHAHILEITWARSGTYGKSGGGIGIVLREA